VCKIRKDLLPIRNVMYKWPPGLMYENLNKNELDKSMRYLRNKCQRKKDQDDGKKGNN